MIVAFLCLMARDHLARRQELESIQATHRASSILCSMEHASSLNLAGKQAALYLAQF